jgi:hypothetical protein
VIEHHLADVLGPRRWRSIEGTAELTGQVLSVG